PQLGMGLLQPPAAGGAGLGLGRVGFPGLLQVVEVERHAPQGAVRTLLLHEERQHAAETRVAYPAVSASPAAHYLTLPFAPPARPRDRPGIPPRPARPPGPPRPATATTRSPAASASPCVSRSTSTSPASARSASRSG